MRIFAIYCALLVLFSWLNPLAGYSFSNPRGMVSSDVQIMVSTSSVKNFIESLNSIPPGAGGGEFQRSLSGVRDNFLRKTGVDILDSYSLKKLGVDTGRPLLMAWFPKVKRIKNIIVIIPVYDGKRFPLKFIKLLQKSNPEKFAAPVITPYKGHTLYQMGRDIFCSSTQGYFILASSGQILRKSLMNSEMPDRTLLYDKAYQRAMSSNLSPCDLEIFVSKPGLQHAANKIFRETGYKKNDLLGFSMPDFFYGGGSLTPQGILVKAVMAWPEVSLGKSLPDFFDFIKKEPGEKNDKLSHLRLAVSLKSLLVKRGDKFTFSQRGEIVAKKLHKILGSNLYKEIVPHMGGELEFVAGDLSDSPRVYTFRITMQSSKIARSVYKKLERRFSKNKKVFRKPIKISKATFHAFAMRGKKTGVLALDHKDILISNNLSFLRGLLEQNYSGVKSSNRGQTVLSFNLSKNFLERMALGKEKNNQGQLKPLKFKNILRSMKFIAGKCKKKGRLLYFFGQAKYDNP